MKKILSLLLIGLILNNLLIFSVFASANISLNTYSIKVNGASSINGDNQAKPGDTLGFAVIGKNNGDNVSSLNSVFTFSNNDFTYINQGEIDFYKNGYVESENIGTSEFNPPIDNSIVLTPSSESGDILGLYFFDLQIDQDFTDTIFSSTVKYTTNEGNSNTLTRNIFINSRPHIVDYYFEKTGSKVTQLARGGEQVDLIVEVKDYNGCSDIDSSTVIANLTGIGLAASESLLYVSCDTGSNTAKYKKSAISTIIFPTTVTFPHTSFTVTDDSGNTNLPNDSQTIFDDEDKKDNLVLTISSAGTPDIESSVIDIIIGGATNLTTDISYTGSQNGDIKIVSGGDTSCVGGTALSDWTSGYVANTNLTKTINSSNLSDGDNIVTVCLKNDEDKIGSISETIKKDTTSPLITGVSLGPINIVDEDSSTLFTCSENGTYNIERGGNGAIGSGVNVGSGSVLAGGVNSIGITNADINVGDNSVYIICSDEAKNSVSSTALPINKTTLPPSFFGETITFTDSDIDFDGLDGRDLTFSWSNVLGNSYDYFSSYVLYVLPDNIALNTDDHQNIGIIINSNTQNFLGTSDIVNDSVGNSFVGGTGYKMCILINGTNGRLGTPECSTSTILTSDVVSHPTVESARFTSDTNLEIITDTILDTNLSSHSGSLFSYDISGTTYYGISVLSIDGKKINITIPSLGTTDITATNLQLDTLSLRAATGGFNDVLTFGSVTDGQSPTIGSLNNNASAVYGDFYTGSLNISFNLNEELKENVSKFTIIRQGGNIDSNSYYSQLSGPELFSGNNSHSIDLSSLGLVDGVTYQIRLSGEDLAGNYTTSTYITDIKYDTVGPDVVLLNNTALLSTITPTLTWGTPLDNLGNGSGIKEYKLNFYNGDNCTGEVNQSHTTSSTSQILNAVTDIADYSWTVVAYDNLDNVGIVSECSNLTINSTIPFYTNYSINDNVLVSSDFLKQDNSITISSEITDTNIEHIWLDISMITGNTDNDYELCNSPSLGVTCTYVGNTVSYGFTAGSGITDGVKQVIFNSQNVSGGNDSTQVVSITADSNSPIINTGALLTPNSLIGGLSSDITWSNSNITDTIGVTDIILEYSTGSSVWNTIGTTTNNGLFSWDLTSIATGNDYKIKLTAQDGAGNSSFIEGGVFEIDRTNPTISSSTLISPNGSEIFGGNTTYDILWNTGSIADTNLGSNPISLYYSQDSGTNWNLIIEDITNTGSYTWTHGNIDSTNMLIRIDASDIVGNISSDTSDISFIIDTTIPELDFNFSSTPTNGSYINNSGFDINGSTSDIHFDELGYIFQNTTTGEYFNGSVFTGSTEVINNICTDGTINGTNGSCDIVSFNLLSFITDGDDYRLILNSSDEAGNFTRSIPVDYVGDTVSPDLGILTASGSYFKDSINISGTSADASSGLSSVNIQIKKGTDYWDGASFVSGVQSLNTVTSNGYTNWSYDFAYNGTDGEIEVIVLSYDKSYKVNNSTQKSIIINKDGTIPTIVGGNGFFTSPMLGDIYIGGNTINILWNTGSISDNGSGLKTNPIGLEYFDGTDWQTISSNLVNDGFYNWASASIDTNIAEIRVSVTDEVDNRAYQSSNSFTIDSTPPTISTVETMDMDANGEIDALNITMSEPIVDSTVVLSDFVISHTVGIPTGFETGGSANDNQFVLKFSNLSGIYNSATTPSIAYTKGSLTDIAGKFLENNSYTLSTDKAIPRISKSEMFDSNSNGKFDKIEVTFSENLSQSSDITAWTIENILTGMNIISSSVSGDTVTIQIDESDDFDTSVGAMQLTLNGNSNWTDQSGNQVGNITSGTIIDLASPVAYKAEYFDLNSSYKVDSVDVFFSEDLLSFSDNDFIITGLTKNSGTSAGNKATFTITETTSDNDTGVTATLSFNSGNLKDSSDNFVANFTSFNIDDKVIPKLISINTNDDDGNGKIDNLLLEYSEDLLNDFSNFVGEVDGYNILSSSIVSNNTIEISVSEKDIYDSDITPMVRINSNNSLSDLNGNYISTFSYITSIDKVGPVIIGARYDETSHEIILETSESFNSGDFVDSSFALNNAGSYSIVSSTPGTKSIVLSNEVIDYGSTEISFVGNSVGDSLGNKQSGTYFIKISSPIIINEVMLSTDSNNNYIELRNLSNNIVDISGYTVAGITIPSTNTIAGNGYFLISKASEVTSIINVAPDIIDASLNIAGSELTLNNGVLDIDIATLTPGLFDTVTPKAVERKNNSADGSLSSSWYTAQDSVGFDSNTYYGTPSTVNIFDAIAPTIISYTPNDNVLFPSGNFDVNFAYSDNVGGLGIDIASDNLSLSKWNGSSWGADISNIYVDFLSETINSTSANYDISSLEYGKYRISFNISDLVGNMVSKEIIFYVDEFTFSIDKSTINIGSLTSSYNTFSTDELIITVNTVGAGFNLDMLKNGLFTNNGTDIIDYDGNFGFGYDIDNLGYSGNISSMGSNVNIGNEALNINTDGDKNTFVYKIKYGAKIDIVQGAGYYITTPYFNIQANY